MKTEKKKTKTKTLLSCFAVKVNYTASTVKFNYTASIAVSHKTDM